MNEVNKKRFLWGLLLVWAPWLPSLIGPANAFRGIATEKATGLAAAAGGLSEMFVLIGLISTLVFQVVGIVLFVRTFEAGYWIRNVFGVISIIFGMLMLLLIAVFVRMVRMRVLGG